MNDRFKFIKNFEKYSACTNGHIYSNDYNHTGKCKIFKECIDQEREDNKPIKRSECPYGGIDCTWCTEECE